MILAVMSQMVHIGILESLFRRKPQHLVAFLLVQKLAPLIQQFQGVPHPGVVRGCQDDAAAGPLHRHGQFRGRCGSQPDVHHIKAHPHQRAANHVAHHLAGDAGIAPHNNLIAANGGRLTDQRCIGRRKLHNIQRIQRVAHAATNRPANAGNRFYQSHTVLLI